MSNAGKIRKAERMTIGERRRAHGRICGTTLLHRRSYMNRGNDLIVSVCIYYVMTCNDVISRQYDVRTYDDYLRWYVSSTRARLTCPPPERPAAVTHTDQLRMGMDRHRASRRDDTVIILNIIHSS
jgi:hypothetical protein